MIFILQRILLVGYIGGDAIERACRKYRRIEKCIRKFTWIFLRKRIISET